MEQNNTTLSDTICAIATPAGVSAQGVIKISGRNALDIVSKIFQPIKKSANIQTSPGYTALYGWITDPNTGERIDDTIALILRAPTLTQEKTK